MEVKYIDNIDTCTLEVFKKCLNGERKCLLIDGKYDEDKANESWLSIYDEYNTTIKSKGNDIAFEIKKQTHILNNEKVIISTCLFTIAKLIEANFINFADLHEFDNFIKVIGSYGFVFDKAKPAESLTKIQKQLRNYDTRIKSELKKLEDIEKSGGDWTFDDTITTVELFTKFPMPKECTLRRFISYLNHLIKSNNGDKS